MKHALLLLTFVFGLTAEEHNSVTPHKEAAVHEHEVEPATIEMVASTGGSFVNGNAMLRLSKRLYAESHNYKALGGVFGFGGLGFAVLNRPNAKLITSAYATYGEHSGGGVGIRFLGKKDLKNNLYLVTDAHLLQSLSRHGLNNSRTFLDPSHVSLGYKWMQFGFNTEYLHHGLPNFYHQAELVTKAIHEPTHEFGKGVRIFVEKRKYGFGYRLSFIPHDKIHLFFSEYRPNLGRLFRRH